MVSCLFSKVLTLTSLQIIKLNILSMENYYGAYL